MLDLRKLFDKYRIQWRDKGPNCSRGHINIACPFCGPQDRSFHMSISEEGMGFYCFRNPSHAGRNVANVLWKLKIPAKEFADQKVKSSAPREYLDTRSYAAFAYFKDAAENEEAFEYLKKRNFTNPAEASKKFNLKIDEVGKWAGRLIIPLTVGWTGRAMRDYLEPRYLTHSNEDGYFQYLHGSSTVVLLEGGIDAMRIATVTTQLDLIGKCGNKLSAALLVHLRKTGYRTIINCPDGDVSFEQYEKETSLLKSYCTQANVKLFHFPECIKDWGQLTESEARRLIRGL